MMAMMGLWVIVQLLLVGAVAFGLGWRPRSDQAPQARGGESAWDILGARYARGEISREEYEQIRKDLEA